MSLVSDSPEVLARFDEVCSLACADRRGMTLTALGVAHSLARELGADEPDPERVAELAKRLDLDPEHLP